jgi:hypothetical protein
VIHTQAAHQQGRTRVPICCVDMHQQQDGHSTVEVEHGDRPTPLDPPFWLRTALDTDSPRLISAVQLWALREEIRRREAAPAGLKCIITSQYDHFLKFIGSMLASEEIT